MKPTLTCETCGAPVLRDDAIRDINYDREPDGSWRAWLTILYRCSQARPEEMHWWGCSRVVKVRVPAERVPQWAIEEWMRYGKGATA